MLDDLSARYEDKTFPISICITLNSSSFSDDFSNTGHTSFLEMLNETEVRTSEPPLGPYGDMEVTEVDEEEHEEVTEVDEEVIEVDASKAAKTRKKRAEEREIMMMSTKGMNDHQLEW